MPKPDGTGWGTSFSTLNGKSAQVPVWWMVVHALSKGMAAGAVASIPCGQDLQQLRMEVNAERIDNPLLAQEVAGFTNDCYARARAKLFMTQPTLTDKLYLDVSWISSKYFFNTSGYYSDGSSGFRSHTARTAWPYDATRDAGLPQTTGGGGYPTCTQWWSDGSKGLRARLLAQIEPDTRVAIEQARLYLQQLEGDETLTHKRAKATPACFWRCVFEMSWSTGMRLNALLHIRPMDVNLPELKIVAPGEVENTYRQYEVPITESLEPLIRRLCEAVRVSGIGPRISYSTSIASRITTKKKVRDLDQVEAFYKKLSAAVSVRIKPHRLRHTLATDLMKEADHNINVVQTILNHTSLITTLGYIEIMQEVLTERESRARVGRRVARVDESGSCRVLE